MFNWKTITLENYAAIDALKRVPAPEDRMALLDHYASLLSLATGLSEEHYSELPLSELGDKAILLDSFLSVEPSARLLKIFWFGGRRFTIKLTQDEVTKNQAMSTKGLHLTPENMASKMPELLAVITEETFTFRKKLSFAQKVSLFQRLPSSIGIGVCVFFWEVSKELQNSSLTYLETEAAKLMKILNPNN